MKIEREERGRMRRATENGTGRGEKKNKHRIISQDKSQARNIQSSVTSCASSEEGSIKTDDLSKFVRASPSDKSIITDPGGTEIHNDAKMMRKCSNHALEKIS